jgi:hypothetical protein
MAEELTRGQKAARTRARNKAAREAEEKKAARTLTRGQKGARTRARNAALREGQARSQVTIVQGASVASMEDFFAKLHDLGNVGIGSKIVHGSFAAVMEPDGWFLEWPS